MMIRCNRFIRGLAIGAGSLVAAASASAGAQFFDVFGATRPSTEGLTSVYVFVRFTELGGPGQSTCAGDVDGDGDTDVFDFADLASNFGAGPGATRAEGDLTGDGFVDVFDFADLASLTSDARPFAAPWLCADWASCGNHAAAQRNEKGI
jgi:hypothetical protein